ncbi:carbohydrate sulfotransferase 11-like isoform X2 [Mizuhopecten yessoensis]|uniref:carbohydrate sulfotransferase 11-like isoform X2 n=1 Tax=Mizuhopecten yessoensis TaxID=6573 RepID=UPI000B45B0CF|nr:carbohydrate sulfotransferase 11-like isoform X2 [Mizuhopecten yessoensis]
MIYEGNQEAITAVIRDQATFNCSCSRPSPSTLNKLESAPKRTESIFIEEQSERRKTMLTTCRSLGKNYTGTLPEVKLKTHMIYDDQTDLLFCNIAKVGSTFLKQVFQILFGYHHRKDPFSIKGGTVHQLPFDTFDKIQYDQALAVLMRSTKIIFVRNPYTRMLSGYVDKLFTNNHVFWRSTGKIILKNHRKNLSIKSKECGHDSTFPEFIKHVIESETSGKNRNPHWCPMYDVCRPCSIQYDVIGKIESFKEDLGSFLKSQHLDEIVDISKMNQGNEREAIYLTVSRAYDVVLRVPKCASLPQALERAWKVLQIRGVLSQLAEFPYKMIEHNSNISKSLFLDVIAKEIKRFPMTQSDKLLSKEQAVVKAYESVSSSDLERFTSIFHPDFSLFGYEKDIGRKHRNFLKWEPFKFKL